MNYCVSDSVKRNVAANVAMNPGHMSHHTVTDPIKASIGHKILHHGHDHHEPGLKGAIKHNIEHTALTHPSQLSHHTVTDAVRFNAASKLMNHHHH